MSRKQPKRRAGSMVKVAIAGFFVLAIAGGVGFGVASADSSDDLARAGAFGFEEATHAATLSAGDDRPFAPSTTPASSSHALAGASTRDISPSLKMVDDREEAVKEHAKEENEAALKRVQEQKAMQGVTASPDSKAVNAAPKQSEPVNTPQEEPANQAAQASGNEAANTTTQAVEFDLPKVDWTVGKDEFIATWTDRIDAYLKGSNLEGYGAVFAEAAWENGVDPRWSPAISNTESSKGTKCFLPHNAWGWGDNTWPDWPSAIREHVAGLAEVYGYSVTFSAAQKYCPPNYVNWYNNTITEMERI